MNKPTCLIQAPVLSRSGYGDMANKFSLAIIKSDKYDVMITPTRWGSCPSRFLENQLITDDERLLHSKFLTKNLTVQPDLYIQVALPSEYKKIGKYNVGVTAGIETTVPTPQFVEGMNLMDLNVVISTFLKKVFKDARYRKQFTDGSNRVEDVHLVKPIEPCFIGVDETIFKKTDVISKEVNDMMEKVKEDFCILFVGMWTHSNSLYADRKDIGMLIKTFLLAHRGNKNAPALVLKTSGATQSTIDRNECLKRIEKIKQEVGGDDLPNVYLLHGELTQVQMNELYNHPKIKAHISFTHGEGFGIPLLEASFSGKPMLVSNWSGHLDFLGTDTATMLQGDVKPVQPQSVNDWIIKESQWFYVNYDKAQEKIQNLPDVYDKLLSKGESAMKYNREHFNTTKMYETFNGILDKYVPQFSVQQKIVLPSLKKVELPALKKIE